jgi:hypothetical protein
MEEYQVKFEIRDRTIVYNRVKNPAVVFDRESGTLHRIGERKAMLTYFNSESKKYRANGLHNEADNLTYMELPKDQQEIDKTFQITGYIKKLYEETFAHAN